MSYHDEIRTIARKRNIEHLVHFTQVRNLPSIVQHGVLSREILDRPEYVAYVGDPERIDGRPEAVSVSISAVNWEVFNSKRRKSGHEEWAILVLQPDILWTHSCLFSWCNAASMQMRDHTGFRGGPWALEMMFAGDDAVRAGLGPSVPTDPEAEVQVLEPIRPECIIGAMVNSLALGKQVDDLLALLAGGPREVVVVPSF